MRGFGGQVSLPGCQHPPAPAAVGVASTSKRKGRGALAGTGKPCLPPAPSQALPADLHVPRVHPDGPKRLGSLMKAGLRPALTPPGLWTPIPHASSPARRHPRWQASPAGMSHPPRRLGLADTAGCCSQGSASHQDPHCPSKPGTTGGAGRAGARGIQEPLGRRRTAMPQDFALLPIYPAVTRGASPLTGKAELAILLCVAFPPPPGLPVKREDNKKLPPRSAGFHSCKGWRARHTKPPLPSFPRTRRHLSFKQTPWPLSCQGTRAAPELEFARLLPWSKESETLPLETKHSIRHFTCQEYIQPPKKEILPAEEPATKALDFTGEAEPGIGHFHPAPDSLPNSKSPKIKRAVESGQGWRGRSHPRAGRRAPGQDGWWEPAAPAQDATRKIHGLGKKKRGRWQRQGWRGQKLPPAAAKPAHPGRASPAAGGAPGEATLPVAAASILPASRPPARRVITPRPFPVASPGKRAARSQPAQPPAQARQPKYLQEALPSMGTATRHRVHMPQQCLIKLSNSKGIPLRLSEDKLGARLLSGNAGTGKEQSLFSF